MNISLPPAILPIFIASILGSPHCAGMCGGFVAWYSHESKRHIIPHLLYSVGRLVTYLSLGIAAATVGHSLDDASSIARTSALLVGASLVVAGIAKIFGQQSKTLLGLSEKFGPALGKLMKLLPSIPLTLRPLLIGIVTTLLPCGWLYTFVALAMASADISQAVVIMTVFWLGTLPVMSTLGFFSRILTQRLGRYLPRVTGILLVLGGILSLTLHFQHAGHSNHHGCGLHEHHESN